MLESPLIAYSSEFQTTDSDCISVQGEMSKLNMSSVLVQLWIRLHSSFQCIFFTVLPKVISENVPSNVEKKNLARMVLVTKKGHNLLYCVLHAFCPLIGFSYILVSKGSLSIILKMSTFSSWYTCMLALICYIVSRL